MAHTPIGASQVSTERTRTVSTPSACSTACCSERRSRSRPGASALRTSRPASVRSSRRRREPGQIPGSAGCGWVCRPCGSSGDTAIGFTVLLLDDHFLAYVDQTAGQIARSAVRAPCRPNPCGRHAFEMKVLEHRQSLTEVRNDRPGNDVALRLATRPRIPAIWRACMMFPRAPERMIMSMGLNFSALRVNSIASLTRSVASVQISINSWRRSSSVMMPFWY